MNCASGRRLEMVLVYVRLTLVPIFALLIIPVVLFVARGGVLGRLGLNATDLVDGAANHSGNTTSQD